MQTLLMDIRFGLRMLRANPGFTITALILTLGIAADTVIFSVFDALVLRPLPYTDASRLVRLSEGNDQLKSWGPASYVDFQDWKTQSRHMDRMACLAPESVNTVVAGDAERLKGIRVSGDLIPLLGLQPELGRPFLAEDYVPGRTPAVILGHGFWQRRFSARPDAAGQTIRVGGQPHVVAGVMPQAAKMGFLLGFEPDLWLPLIPRTTARDARTVNVIARLRSGDTIEQAQAEMSVIARRLEQQYPESNAGWKARVDGLRGSVDPLAYVLLSILVASILGITCTNVANLLLVRAAGRQKEIAVRAALGAGRWRLVRQWMTESTLLALAGSGFGALTASVACHLIRVSAAGTNMEVLEIGPDTRVLCFSVLLFVASGFSIGLLPAFRFSRFSLIQSLKQGGTDSSPGLSGLRTGNFLSALEIALSLILLAGGGVAIKSWFSLWHVDSGFESRNILTAVVSLTESEYPDSKRQLAFFQALISRLESRPGIAGSGLTSSLPTAGPLASFIIPDRPRHAPGEEPRARLTSVTGGYLKALSIPLKTGRLIDDGDDAGALPVAMVSETLAKRHWGGQNPVGYQLEMAGQRRTIIGVFGDLRNSPLALKPYPEIYLPFSQAARGHAILTFRSTGHQPSFAAETLRDIIRSLDSNQPVGRIETLEKVLRQNMGVITLGSRVLALLGIGALALAAVGVYGVLSYTVARRGREFGIRAALGATRADVLRLVLGQALRIILAGLVPGTILSLLLVSALSRTMYGVRALEPSILGVVALLLVCATLLAACIPARRATRADPMVALRGE